MFKWFFLALFAFDVYRWVYPAEKFSLIMMPANVRYVSLPLYASRSDAEKVASLMRSQLPQKISVAVVKSTSTYFEKQNVAENPQAFLTFGN